jgi:hypothetical protein
MVRPSRVLAATLAGAMLASFAGWAAARAQEPAPLVRQGDDAVMGYQQPRIGDLPSGVARDEQNTEPELDAIGKQLEQLENKLCPGC